MSIKNADFPCFFAIFSVLYQLSLKEEKRLLRILPKDLPLLFKSQKHPKWLKFPTGNCFPRGAQSSKAVAIPKCQGVLVQHEACPLTLWGRSRLAA
jgi:hypothetical protein